MKIKLWSLLVVLILSNFVVAENPQYFRLVKVKCLDKKKNSYEGYLPVLNAVVPDTIRIKKGNDLTNYFQKPLLEGFSLKSIALADEFYEIDTLGYFFAEEEIKTLDISDLTSIVVKNTYDKLSGSLEVPKMPKKIIDALKNKAKYRKIDAIILERIYIDVNNTLTDEEFDFLLEYSPDSSFFQDILFDKTYYSISYAFKAATYDSTKVKKNYGLSFLENRWTGEIDAKFTKENAASFIPEMVSLNTKRIENNLVFPKQQFTNKYVEAYKNDLIKYRLWCLRLHRSISEYLDTAKADSVIAFISEMNIDEQSKKQFIKKIEEADGYFARFAAINLFLTDTAEEFSILNKVRPNFLKILQYNNIYEVIINKRL